MARHRTGLRNVVEFLLARSALGVSGVLPGSWLGPVSRGFGRMLYGVIGSRRRVVRANVWLAFGDGPDAPDADALGRASLANLCLAFMEMTRAPRTLEELERRVMFRDGEALARLRARLQEGPVVLAASHFAAYEVMGWASALFGPPSTTLVRPLDNPRLERWLKRVRQRFGQVTTDNRGGMRELLRALRQGAPVGVLVDLNHRPSNRVFVDFFGTSAATAPTAAVLAVRFRCPIVTVVTRRTKTPLHYEVEVGPLHEPRSGAPHREEVRRLLQVVTWEVEERVRAEPALWLWTHNRWKTRPDADEESKSRIPPQLPPPGDR
jgi:KDO2-lipid IV(A) lauroyltransferase